MFLSTATKLSLQILQEMRCGYPVSLGINANLQQLRHRKTKHWSPKFKLLRKLKVIKVKIPNLREKNENLTEEEMRSKLKERGMQPSRPWSERQFFISTTGSVFEPYVPPEGDGKVSSITAQGAKQKLQFLEKKTKTIMAIRKIRSYEENFDTTKFCKVAEDIYIKAHECLIKNDKEEIQKYVTEKAYPEIVHNIKNKTIHWKFLKSIELPRIAHARCTDVITKENIFGQVTVRFHSQQLLAIYDRFGRLIQGSEILAKDVLEYVVFEKHVSNEYGVWRIHGKIIPDWLPSRESPSKTFKKLPDIESSDVLETQEKNVQQQTTETQPAAA